MGVGGLDGVLDLFVGIGDCEGGCFWGDVHSDVGVCGVSVTVVVPPSLDVLADAAACWPRGLEVPLLPSSITCRMVCRGM